MSKHTTLTEEQIDGLNYKEAIKAARAAGAKGIWVATAKTDTFRRFLKGEITAAQAEEATLGSSGTASATPAASAAIEEAINRIVEEQTSDMREDITSKGKLLGEAWSVLGSHSSKLDELESKISSVASGVGTGTGGVATSVTDPDVIKRPEFETATDTLAKVIRVNNENINDKIDKLANDIAEAIKSGGPSVARKISAIIAPTPSSTACAVSFALERYASPARAVKPLLIKGEPGAGKTYQARQHGLMFDHYIEVGIHNATEATDLLGYQTPTVPWVDGPMSEAWRKAALGETVLFVADEILRARASVQTLFLTPFQPTNIGGVDYYKLRTGRFIEDPKTGVHISEELLAPVANLAIVATTNVGAQYDVDEGDPATKRRFVHVHVKVDNAKVGAIVDGYVKARSFSSSVTDSITAFWMQCKVLVADGFLGTMPNISTFCEAVQFATDEADVPTELYRLGMNLWVANTLEGEPEPEQVKKVTGIMASAFGSFAAPVGM
jgi:hypothetical protein